MPFRGIDEGTKRKIVYPDDLIKYYKVWDNKIKKVFHKLVKQDQPLKELIHVDLWEKIEAVCKGEEELDSILLNYYKA